MYVRKNAIYHVSKNNTIFLRSLDVTYFSTYASRLDKPHQFEQSMSFSPKTYQKKLEALQDSQESIVSISQWLLFHHRHSKEICELWAQYILSEDPTVNLKKKLALLYLCNDIVQQARHKREPEFSKGFAYVLPRILHNIYPTINQTLQPKIDRLIGVWEQRNIFEKADIGKMRKAIQNLKSGKDYLEPSEESNSSKSQASAPISSELIHLNDAFNLLTKTLDTASANLSQVGMQCKLYLPQNPENLDNLPLPNVYLTKLNVLEKLCHMTNKNLEDASNARKNILKLLANLSNMVSDGLATDETKIKIIEQRLERLETTKLELNEIIGTGDDGSELHAGEQIADNEDEDEEPSPTFENASEPEETIVPTYEDSSDDDDNSDGIVGEMTNGFKRRRVDDDEPTNFQAAPTTQQFKAAKKSVAFSEDIQVKEFVREENPNELKIISSDGDSDDVNMEEDEEDSEKTNEFDLKQFEMKHRDDLELKHKKKEEFDSVTYGSSTKVDTGHSETGQTNGNSQDQANSGLLSLLSKLS